MDMGPKDRDPHYKYLRFIFVRFYIVYLSTLLIIGFRSQGNMLTLRIRILGTDTPTHLTKSSIHTKQIIVQGVPRGENFKI